MLVWSLVQDSYWTRDLNVIQEIIKCKHLSESRAPVLECDLEEWALCEQKHIYPWSITLPFLWPHPSFPGVKATRGCLSRSWQWCSCFCSEQRSNPQFFCTSAKCYCCSKATLQSRTSSFLVLTFSSFQHPKLHERLNNKDLHITVGLFIYFFSYIQYSQLLFCSLSVVSQSSTQ